MTMSSREKKACRYELVINKAAKARKNKESEKAIGFLKEAIKIDDIGPVPYVQIAEIKLENHDRAGAIEYYRNAVDAITSKIKNISNDYSDSSVKSEKDHDYTKAKEHLLIELKHMELTEALYKNKEKQKHKQKPKYNNPPIVNISNHKDDGALSGDDCSSGSKSLGDGFDRKPILDNAIGNESDSSCDSISDLTLENISSDSYEIAHVISLNDEKSCDSGQAFEIYVKKLQALFFTNNSSSESFSENTHDDNSYKKGSFLLNKSGEI
jgi:hypothetical protein